MIFVRKKPNEFDEDTVPDEVINCLITKYGSIENYKATANDIYETTTSAMFAFDDTGNYWMGWDGQWNIDQPSRWRWTDATETGWYYCHPNYDCEACSETETCEGDFTSAIAYFNFVGDKLYVTDTEVMSFDYDCITGEGENYNGRMSACYELIRADDSEGPSPLIPYRRIYERRNHCNRLVSEKVLEYSDKDFLQKIRIVAAD
ncbi:MAG: hypothetical protein LBS25_03205 [Candidatus Symbiothrix sp.]|jgi:hypothetical protein|nr:hypothetical protein [Candidatus Symbiothrix sp.]